VHFCRLQALNLGRAQEFFSEQGCGRSPVLRSSRELKRSMKAPAKREAQSSKGVASRLRFEFSPMVTPLVAAHHQKL
jgi:hypothetical protein